MQLENQWNWMAYFPSLVVQKIYFLLSRYLQVNFGLYFSGVLDNVVCYSKHVQEMTIARSIY
ncbi:hypothetical protein KY284_005269 [Solanum tuberosum]|nr:hypothetical protein KY284_005269 [Solanum tuberosum]